MKKFFSCLLVFALLFVNCGIISLAGDSDEGIPAPYVISDSVDYNLINSSEISDEAPKYYYDFENGKPNWNSYSLLDDCQKKIYDSIVNAPIGTTNITINFENGEFSHSDFNKTNLSKIMNAICNDRPDIFYYKGYTAKALLYENRFVKSVEYNIVFSDEVYYTQENVPGYHAEMINTLKSLPVDTSNRYNFVKSVHDYLCNSIYYPDLNTSDYVQSAHDAYGALVEKRAVCQGYSDAFKLICDYYKIPAVCIGGTANGGNHMWNAVQMDDGLWYLIDITWDDQFDNSIGEIYNDFFLVGTETYDIYFGGNQFSESHINDPDLYLPVLKYATEKYSQTNHFTEFGATFNNIAKKDGNYLIRSYFDVYDSYIYYDGMYVEVNSPVTNSKFSVKSGADRAEEEWTLVSLCDCNGDALADSNDYSEAVNKVLNGDSVDDAFDMAADADCDGYLDVIDLVIIERAISGKITNIALE